MTPIRRRSAALQALCGALLIALMAGCQDTAVLLFDHRLGRESVADEVQPLRFATSLQVASWSPLEPGGLHEGSALVHAALYDRDPVSGALREDLVQRATIDSSDRTLDLFLREARFHDGRPLRAADVASSIERARAAAARPGLRAALAALEIERIEVQDERTLSLFAGSASALREILPAIAILPEDRPEGLVGAGPFIVLGGVGGIFDLQAFEGWHRGPPRLGRIELHTGVHPDQQARGLLRGTYDLALLPGAYWLQAEDRRSFTTQVRASDELVVALGTPREIDRRAWLEAGFAGRASPYEVPPEVEQAATPNQPGIPATSARADAVLENLAAAYTSTYRAAAPSLARGPFPRGVGAAPDRMLAWLDTEMVQPTPDLIQAFLADGRIADAGRARDLESALTAQGISPIGRFDWLLVASEDWQVALPPGALGTIAVARSLPDWSKR